MSPTVMDTLRWFLILSPLLVLKGSAQPLPRPLLPGPLLPPRPLFPALPQPLPVHLFQMLAPEVAQEAGSAPSASVLEVMACPLGFVRQPPQ